MANGEIVCLKLSSEAEKIVMRSLKVLTDLQHAWPQSQKWLSALQKVSTRHISKKGKPLKAMASQQRFLSAAVSRCSLNFSEISVTSGLTRNN
jgi:CTP-dependent riboflavin kinase